MAKHIGNRPAEIFGYLLEDQSQEAQTTREKRICPFVAKPCNKQSRLINFPFGVCTVECGGEFRTICPRRFEERGTLADVPRVLETIALHYFGDWHNTIPFAEVKLPNVGSIDYVLVRHKPLKPEVEDFVSIEFQSDSTSNTGKLIQAVRDFLEGHDTQSQKYGFGVNTYDTIKRAITQVINKGIVYEAWDTKCYWVIQEYIYANLVKRYGFKKDGFSSEHASRFALHKLVSQDGRLTMLPNRFISTTVDEVYQAMRNNPALPSKDKFVHHLNTKLQAKLSLQFFR